ncbi:hypothetical protein AAZX31_04G105000 [Glycine max]
MAAVNEWLNGYLEAILDVGSSVKKKKNDGKVKNFAKFEEEKDQRGKKSCLIPPPSTLLKLLIALMNMIFTELGLR